MGRLEDEYFIDKTESERIMHPDNQEDFRNRQHMKRVLVVEDDHDMQAIIKMAIYDFCNMAFVDNGMDALPKALQFEPDLILLDWMLPKIAGHQLIKMFRAKEQLKDVPIIFITAKNTPSAKQTAMKLGVQDFIGKPFDPKDLINTVKKHLG